IYGFAQNHKDIETYQESVESGFLPVFRGHMLNQEDLIIRQHILDLMCRFSTTLLEAQMPYRSILERLAEPLQDELIELSGDDVRITEKGRAFIRNICMAFDKRLWRKQPETQLFSSTI
ncbi:MAG: coproporphyrinogen III oxidase, partial [Imperialibacter sp.]